MSSIFSELVVDILLSRASAASDSEKYLVGSVLGVPAAEIYAATIGRADHLCTVHTGNSEDDRWPMRSIALENNVVVIPYLVLQDRNTGTSADANRGNRGFNGKLRDWFDRQTPTGEIRVLITFDEDPIETAKTAMDQALQSSLTATALLSYSGKRVLELAGRAVAPLITEILRFVGGRTDLSARDVTHTVHALREIACCTTVEDAGNALVQLPWLLRDPDIETGTARLRLKRANWHRQALWQAVHAPTEDFEQLVRALYEAEFAENLLVSTTLGGVNWQSYTLREFEEALRQPERDLPPKLPNRLDASHPLTVESASAQVLKLVSERDSGERRYGVAALVSPGRNTVTVRLARQLEDRETIHLFTYRPKGGGFIRDTTMRVNASTTGAQTEISLTLEAAPLNENWCCVEVVLTSGATFVKNYLGRADVALLLQPGLPELPYESECSIDASTQRFVANDQAAVELQSLAGAVRSAPTGSVRSVGTPGSEIDTLVVSMDENTVSLPVRYELEPENELEIDGGELSAEHAILRFAASENTPIGEIDRPALFYKAGGAFVSVGGRETQLIGIPKLRASRWAIESAILRLPGITNYRVGPDGALTIDERLASLSMGAATAPAFASYLGAREAFFKKICADQEIATYQTVLASDLVEMQEAKDYVSSYNALLDAIPDGVNWQSEYERILLMDSVLTENEQQVLIAPTSPLAVAAHMRLQQFLHDWANDDPTNLLANDPNSLMPTYLMPLIRIGEQWHESEPVAYPWRLYQPRDDTTDTYTDSFLPAFIARRIAEFLDVHPAYRNHRRVLTLAFVNAGDASHVLSALQMTLNKTAKQGEAALDELPQFEVKLYTATDLTAGVETGVGSALDSFMSNTQEATPTWTQLELMRRLTYTKATIDEFIYDTSASTNSSSFAHIAFVQNYFRPGELEAYTISDRTSTAYLGGTASDLERAAEIHANDITFSSGIWIGQQSREQPLTQLMSRSLEVSASARGNPVTSGRALGIVTRVQKRLIPLIYDRAVWVVHLDKHVGLELFYPQDEQEEKTPYILDHTDQENLQASGFDAITATTMVSPYLTRINAIFGRHVAGFDEVRTIRMLRWLNLLSGRWALRLLREPDTAVKERLGAVVAYQMIAVREKLFDVTSDALSLVISLDELLRVTGKEGLRTTEGLAAMFEHKGRASDDLLLLRVPFDWQERPKLFARVIEVKYSEGAPTTDKAWNQIDQTQRLLERIFGSTGPGRPFRGRVLSKLIRSYVSRITAFGLLDQNVERSERFIETLDNVGSGDYEFMPTFSRDGVSLIGDFISIEPNYEVPLYQPAPYSPSDNPDRLIGRVRIGGSMISALIADSSEAKAGSYSPPIYWQQESTGDGLGSSDGKNLRGPRGDAVDASRDQAAAASVPQPPGRGITADEKSPDLAEQPRSSGKAEDSEGKIDAAVAAKSLLAERFTVPEDEVRRLADKLDQVFARYQLPVQPFQPSLAQSGPNLLRFRTRMLEAGTIGSIEARSRDIHRELAVDDPVYIGQQPPFVVVDIPRQNRAVITFRDALPILDGTPRQPGVLPVVMGVDAAGQIEIADLAQMPHLLVAGTTGSGKSVFLSTVGACLALLPPSQLEIIVVDIKGLDLTAFSQLAHTREGGIIEDPDQAVAQLASLMEEEVPRRRSLFRKSGARHIIEHYQRTPATEWPKQIVVMIDEYAQLISASGQGRSALEQLVQQYAQFARAFGIYLVLATQRPSVDVITGRIKANLPARCVFKLPSFNDSRTVIDTGGAEKLLGAGDMLFYREGVIERLQAIYTDFDDFAELSARH